MSSVDHHAEILRGGPKAWNAWRKKRPATIPHLSGVVLAAGERELAASGAPPINLKSAHLQEAVFRFATLSAANLQAADLARADLVHARLNRADLSEANLQGAALDHADLSGAILRHADLRGASLRFATLEGAALEATNLARADLTHARLAHANLAGANLRGAVLDYADLAGANLSQANLSGARLYNARNLSASQLAGCFGDAATILPPHLQGCVPWSAAGDEPRIPSLDPAAMGMLQPRRDVRARTLYAPAVRVAGVLLVGAVAATSFVTETARETLTSSPTKAQKSVEPTLSVLRAVDRQFSALSPAAVPAIEATASPPSLPAAQAGAALPPAPTPDAVQPPSARITQQAPVMASEAVPRIFAAIELRPSKAADTTLAASQAAEGLMAANAGAVLASLTGPVTLALASARLSPLKPRRSAVRELRTRAPKIPVLALGNGMPQIPVLGLGKPLRVSLVLEARAAMPAVRALDGPELPAQVTQRQGTLKPASQAVAAVPEPMMLVVSLDAQKIDIYRGLKPIASAKISSGMPGYDTRTGVFSILQKKRRHHSNLYSGAPMPFMQRLTRSGTALHAGAIPGYPASHGCVRLPYSFAPKLFEMTSVGENVVVTRGRPAPKPIAHPNLFEPPRPNPLVAMATDSSTPSQRLSDAVVLTSADASRDQDQTAAFRSDAPLRILVTRRTAHDRVMAVQYMLADMGLLPRQNFNGNLGTATRGAIKAFQKANGLPETGALTDALVRQVYGAAGKAEPPAGHLFVRQDFNRVFDMPVAFRDPEISLGTHVFTVVKQEEEARPQWMAVSLEGDAARALDRIDFPDEVRLSIAPRLTPGSTLIIADKAEYSAILPEGDDFLVSSGEQPETAVAEAEPADAAPVRATPVKARQAKPRAARAMPAAKPRTFTSYRREIRRRAVGQPSPFGMPYLFGR